MNASVETSRPEAAVDVMDGGDVDSELGRSLSVGQLQLALRTAHLAASGPVPHAPVDLATKRGAENRDPQSHDTSRLDRELSSWSPKVLGAALVTVSGLRNLGLLLTARKERRTGRTPAASPEAPGVWDVPRREWAGSLYDRARRWAVLAAAVMLLVVGAVTVTGRVMAMVDPAPVLVAAAPRVSDVQFAGAAQAAVFDYLSWDATAPRATRTTDLNRRGFNEAVRDGWAGAGQLAVENIVAVAVLRTTEDQAVVTVQARATASTPAHATTLDTIASSPPEQASEAMWLTVAVPVALRGTRIVPTASPVLVGSPPNQAPGPAVRVAADEDTDTGRAAADTVNKLITAYGSGDLEFVRGPGSTFAGLAGMVTAGQVQSWRMAWIEPGGDPSLRSGDVTVLWTLPRGAGQLRCTYRIQLAQRENRWLLQQITPAVEGSS